MALPLPVLSHTNSGHCNSAKTGKDQRTMAAEKRGSIAFFSTYRPPVPLDIYSSRLKLQSKPEPDVLCMTDKPEPDVLCMTDGKDYNYNGQVIPPAALKALLKRLKLYSERTDAEVASGHLSGIIFVSERGHLEILYIALRFPDKPTEVFSLADVFGTTEFNGIRMEDSGCFAGDYLIYITTKEPAPIRRQPWTAVYRTNLETGKTDRLTPKGQADLNPAVSRSGNHILVASFEREEKKDGWNGEIEDLQTDIFLMNIENPSERKCLIQNGGWPTWGNGNVIYFHRKDSPQDPRDPNNKEFWGVYRFDISKNVERRVTPEGIDAITPAAIDSTRVAVATIRKKSNFGDIRTEDQYRHIEVFDSTGQQESIQLTRHASYKKADHFNPFVIDDGKDMLHIGYHRCRDKHVMEKEFQGLDSPKPDVDLFRVSGVFPTINKDGSMLAFVDNEFKSVWVVDKNGLHLAYLEEGSDRVWSPVWNQNPEKDTLYVCVGPSFSQNERVEIHAITHVSRFERQIKQLTIGTFIGGDGTPVNANSGFPSSSPDGTRFVFRSVRDDNKWKNLYIMEDAAAGEIEGRAPTRLTNGNWVDTHCQWSPSGDWIVFSSTHDKPENAPLRDNDLDAGYFSVFLLNVKDPTVWIRVIHSGDDLAGHVNHPSFSPDGKSIVVAADIAAVSVDPISLPLFLHSVRPYGDIFVVDIDSEDINKNQNLSNFTRMTHSRYENSTAVWTKLPIDDPNAAWNKFLKKDGNFTSKYNELIDINKGSFSPTCPYMHGVGEESWHMTGHLIISEKRCC